MNLIQFIMKTQLISITNRVVLVIAVVMAGYASSLAATEQRTVSGFTRLHIGGSFEVILSQGNSEGLTVTAETEMMPHILTKVENGTLKITTDNKWHSSGKMKLEIAFIDLSEIDCSGAIQLSSAAPVKFKEIEIATSGSAKTQLQLTAHKLDVDISGAGSTEINGKVQKVELDISGSGKYVAPDLTSETYEINISGAGHAEVYAANSLDVSVSGSGLVKYKGNPRISQDISGSGKIVRVE